MLFALALVFLRFKHDSLCLESLLGFMRVGLWLPPKAYSWFSHIGILASYLIDLFSLAEVNNKEKNQLLILHQTLPYYQSSICVVLPFRV